MALIGSGPASCLQLHFLQSIFLGRYYLGLEFQEEYVPSVCIANLDLHVLLCFSLATKQQQIFEFNLGTSLLYKAISGSLPNVYINITQKHLPATTHTKYCSLDLGSHVGAPTKTRLGFSGPIFVSMSLESSLRIRASFYSMPNNIRTIVL